MDIFGDYERKRQRALEHLAALRASVEDFVHADREPVRGKFGADSSEYSFKVPLERIDPDWALLVGDFVFNLRASLDYLVTALIRASGNEESYGSEFPIHGIDRTPWDEIDRWWEADPQGRIKRQLLDTPSGTKRALKTLQPFYGVPRVDPFRHPLYVLRELSNRDKHRRLNLLVRRAQVTFTNPRDDPLYVGPSLPVRISNTTRDGTFTASLAVREQHSGDVLLRATDASVVWCLAFKSERPRAATSSTSGARAEVPQKKLLSQSRSAARCPAIPKGR